MMEELNEFEARMDALIARISSDEDDTSSVELKITAKKQENKPASLDQLFKELIDEYNVQVNKTTDHRSFLETICMPSRSSSDEEKRGLSESVCKVNLAAKDFLNVSDENGDRFILVPNRDGAKFDVGGEYYFYTEQYNGYDFLIGDCSVTDYSHYFPLFDGLDADERYALIEKAKADPEGFAMWGKLGKVTRPHIVPAHSYMNVVRNRAEELLKRIPLDRDDLYNSLYDALGRFNHSPSIEKDDREKDLRAKMSVISMMLSNRYSEPVTAECLTKDLAGAKVSIRDLGSARSEDWLPNILICGRAYKNAVNCLSNPQRTFMEISMGGVESNDYLFGNPMCYTGTHIGELVARLTETDKTPSVVLFSDVDLMGTTVRSSNPLFGLTALLRKHTFTDFYMRTLPVDVRHIQFVCQVSRIEDCPELLMREMDIVVEL